MFRTKSAAMSAGTVEHSSSEPAPAGGAAGGDHPDIISRLLPTGGCCCLRRAPERMEPQTHARPRVVSLDGVPSGGRGGVTRKLDLDTKGSREKEVMFTGAFGDMQCKRFLRVGC